jgi:hypothetical protein
MQDARNRARGVLSEMTARLSDEEAPDWILEERVRSNLGRIGQHARAVTVDADGGRIYLTGHVLRGSEDAIVKTAMRTRGVHGVEDRLQVVDNPHDIPALQPSVLLNNSLQIAQRNWSPATAC